MRYGMALMSTCVILVMGNDVKMLWIYAAPDLTAVINLPAIRDNSIRGQHSDDMRPKTLWASSVRPSKISIPV